MNSNHDAMAAGTTEYGHVLDALYRAGTPATFTQTGGSCPALEVRLDTGHTLLITEADDCLAWRPQNHRTWGVGLYPPHSEYDQGPDRFLDSDDPSTATLLALVRELLRQPLVTPSESTMRSMTHTPQTEDQISTPGGSTPTAESTRAQP